ncbi:MAG TPA: sugar kinase, partial [Streptomyces sp.]
SQGALDPRTPPAWQGAVAQVLEPGDELAVGRAVRQQYGATRDQIHPGAFDATL